MQSGFSRIGRLAAGIGASAVGLAYGASALADELVGQPTNAAIDFQPAASQIRRDVISFHDNILLPIIVLITLLVLGLEWWLRLGLGLVLRQVLGLVLGLGLVWLKMLT